MINTSNWHRLVGFNFQNSLTIVFKGKHFCRLCRAVLILDMKETPTNLKQAGMVGHPLCIISFIGVD